MLCCWLSNGIEFTLSAVKMDTFRIWLASGGGWFADLHRDTTRALALYLRQAEALDATALLAAAFAFLLGVLHAATPGHGKIVVFSYFFGRDAHPWTGAAMALKIAAVHIGTAVVLFAVLDVAQTVFFGRPTGPARALQAISYLAIAVIGAVLLYRTVRHPRTAGHGTGGSHRSGALPLAVGLLPCPLTLLILSYALAHASLAAGLVLVSIMGLGVATTIGGVALLGMLTRHTALAVIAVERVARAQWSLEVVSNALIVVVGLGLFLMAVA
jgi:ABC-type nickel/cobalt efflux system permease component RcnA